MNKHDQEMVRAVVSTAIARELEPLVGRLDKAMRGLAPQPMTDEQFVTELASIVREAIDDRMVPMRQQLEQLRRRCEQLEQYEARIVHLERLGTELELLLAERAGFSVGQRSAAMQ